jgi:hypothetical protein
MGRIFSIHEYDLRDETRAAEFEQALARAEASGTLEIPGMTSHHFVRGIKGHREGRYAAIWVYESRSAWEEIWGAPGQPFSPERYPAGWRRWEEILAAHLDRPAEAIRFSAYEELGP